MPPRRRFNDYLGAVGRLGLDMQAVQGNLQVVGGIQKYIIGCNWKFAVDNVWDWYHGPITHASQVMSGYNWGRRLAPGERPRIGPNVAETGTQNVLVGEYGHAISGPAAIGPAAAMYGGGEKGWRTRPEVKDALGPVGVETGGHPNIFPTMWLTASQVSLRIPRGPLRTEIWWFTSWTTPQAPMTGRGQIYRANHTFGPGGMGGTGGRRELGPEHARLHRRCRQGFTL
jgi:phenylpropionate dioxygenase-like ring-hydroxylating dioxygenase large terminal subunit